MGEFLFHIGILVAIPICVTLIGIYRKEIWRWLKGSRTSYYIDKDGVVKTSNSKLRTPLERVGTEVKPANQGLIEISHGWLRPPSAIYGDYHTWPWKVADVEVGQAGVSVDLRDERGLPIETALRLINTYHSLQAMFDRITELEQESVREKRKRIESVAVLQALIVKILDDKQRFRSPAAGEICNCISFALREMVEVNIYRQRVDLWLEKFSKLDLKTGLLKPVTK